MKKVNIEIEYAGLKLKNPIIISSSSLTDNLEKIKILENCGAGAVVLKSLFEEQIMMSVNKELASSDYPEAEDVLTNVITTNHLQEYINQIKDCKKEINIPIIASINCYTLRNWVKYAKEIEKAGADALEINIMIVNTEKDYGPGSNEQLHIDILAALKKEIKIPVIMKLGKEFSNLIYLINQLKHNDADAVVLFNRSYTSDINESTLSIIPGPVLSNPHIFTQSLRWVGITSGLIPDIDISLSGGVVSSECVVKSLLAGAKTAQICSAIYKEGPDFIPHILSGLMDWMQKHGFESIKEFNGMLNFARIDDESIYERNQFMKYFSQHEHYPSK